MANRCVKNYSALLIREMQIKMTMRYYLTTVRIAITQKTKDNNCWWGSGKTGTLVNVWWGCKMV